MEFMFNNRLAATLALLVAILEISCASSGDVPYRPNPPTPGVQTTGLRVAVIELDDESPADVEYGLFPAMPFIYVPLIPYFSSVVQYRDTSLGRCFARELEASRQFSRVDYFESWTPIQQTFEHYDAIISGTLRGDRQALLLSSDGLGAAGVLLWLFGLPSEYSTRNLSAELRAFQPTAPYESAWASKIEIDGPVRAWTLYESERAYYQSYSSCPTEQLQPIFRRMREDLTRSLTATTRSN